MVQLTRPLCRYLPKWFFRMQAQVHMTRYKKGVPPGDHWREWMQFKSKYGKSYESEAEEARRFANFMATKQRVDRHNAQENKSFKKGLNHFADWTREEWDRSHGFKVDVSDMARIEAQEKHHEQQPIQQQVVQQKDMPQKAVQQDVTKQHTQQEQVATSSQAGQELQPRTK